MTNKYTEFIKEGEIYKVRNIVYDEIVGTIKNTLLYSSRYAWFSNGCIKEILNFLPDPILPIIRDLGFIQQDNQYEIKTSNKVIGIIKKQRVGRWMHWCLFPEETVGLDYAYLKGISEFITTLYSKKKE